MKRLKRKTIRQPKCKNINNISYPESESEFEVQAKLYRKLVEVGYDVRGEVKAVCEDFGRRRKCRFDLVVFKNSIPKVIIECKNSFSQDFMDIKSRQLRRYSKFALPIVECMNSNMIDEAYEQVEDIMTSLCEITAPIRETQNNSLTFPPPCSIMAGT